MSSAPVRFTGAGLGGEKRELSSEQKASQKLRKRVEELRGNKMLLSRISRPVGK